MPRKMISDLISMRTRYKQNIIMIRRMSFICANITDRSSRLQLYLSSPPLVHEVTVELWFAEFPVYGVMPVTEPPGKSRPRLHFGRMLGNAVEDEDRDGVGDR